MNLTPNQQTVVSTLPATATTIADALGYKSTSGVYDILKRIERANPGVVFSSADGTWTMNQVATDGGSTALDTSEKPAVRVPTTQKTTITKTANEFLSDLESDLSVRLAQYEPTSISPPQRPGYLDMVIFRTDDHFGAYDTEVMPDGTVEEIFSSDIAADRVFQHRDEAVAWKRQLEATGTTFDTGYLLMNGDHVTNESIYEGQAHYIDANLRDQVARAAETYIDVIRSLADEFPFVQVVCQHGNHGELRAKGASHEANADDLLYDALDLALRQSDLDNVAIHTNHVDTHIEWEMRGHRAHMRHGQDSMAHIGTNSAIKRWQSWLLGSGDRYGDTGWDIGYRGHYHELKLEPVNGRPVLMGGTLEPTGDYENSLGIAPGRPGGWCHTVSDDEAIEQLKPVYFR